jgi:hypothetical protein
LDATLVIRKTGQRAVQVWELAEPSPGPPPVVPSGIFLLENGMRFASYWVMGAKKHKSADIALDPSRQAWRSPIQQQLEGLLGELAAFNERIAELVKQGHQSHAMSVLKAQAFSLAGQIDELRCLLAVPKR